ncbi:MAG: hypothetical protein HY696_09795 [Deltaproteobacteria bacterium]|nr:hypothetical protein [Deltaproteobacteria bacterium]
MVATRLFLDPACVAQMAQRFLLTAPAATAAAVMECPLLLGALLVRGPQPLPEPAWPLPELSDLIFGEEAWWDATIERIAGRRSDEHLQLAMQLFPVCLEFHARAVALLPEGPLDVAQVQAAAATVAGWFRRLRRVGQLIEETPDTQPRASIHILDSSSTALANNVYVCLDRAMRSAEPVHGLRAELLAAGRIREAEGFVQAWNAKVYFQIDPTRRELANVVMQSFVASATEMVQDAATGALVLRFPAALPESGVSSDAVGRRLFVWPPEPTAAPLRTFLAALGWRAHWETGPARHLLRLDLAGGRITRIEGDAAAPLAPLLPLYHSLIAPSADGAVTLHAGLRLTQNGLTFTHGPLPDAPDRLGTVIELGAASVEAATDALDAYLNLQLPGCLDRGFVVPGRDAAPVRVILPQLGALRAALLDWGYAYQERTEPLRRAISETLHAAAATLNAGRSLDAQMQATLAAHQRALLQARGLVGDFLNTWELVSRFAVLPVAGVGTGTVDPLGEVCHDLARRAMQWIRYDVEIRRALQGQAASAAQLARCAALVASPGSLWHLLTEAFTLSRTELDAARIECPLNEDVRALIEDMRPAFRPPRRLTDLLANLLTNAARYGAAPVELLAERLPDGGFSFAVRDHGIGILPENLDRLGEPHFREGRRPLAASYGLGLSSVITTLRELGWGPLWVRSRAEEGSEFRFDLPAGALQRLAPTDIAASAARPTPRPHDPWGLGPATRMEQLLDAGFIVPAAAMDLAVPQLLREIPTGVPEHYARDWPMDGGRSRADPHRLLLAGRLRYRRLELLHRLLSGAAGPTQVSAVENAPGTMADTAIVLSQLGTAVVIKEPEGLGLQNHQHAFHYHVPADVRARVRYVSDWEAIHAATPCRVVYWSHPDWQDLVLPAGIGLAEYVGRDVAPGGYVVIETDHHEGDAMRLFGLSGIGNDGFRNLPFPPDQWERVCAADLPNRNDDRTNAVLPTGQEVNIHFQIWRRK